MDSGFIVRSLLDTDSYKFTMGQFAFLHAHATSVRYAFMNRTKNVPLAERVPEDVLRAEIEHARTLRFTEDELSYLAGLCHPGTTIAVFVPEYIQFLRNFRLPAFQVRREGSTYSIEVSGLWHETIYWETFILSIVNELYYRSFLPKNSTEKFVAQLDLINEGEKRLMEKMRKLIDYPDVKIVEFGTRRRYSRAWQEMLMDTIQCVNPSWLIGTSNVALAKHCGLPPIGTFAHEMFMVFAGQVAHLHDDAIRRSHQSMLNAWFRVYHEPLSIALTDTYGTSFFFRDFSPKQARQWRGLRHDSGNPFLFGERVIAFYEKLFIDPKTKIIVFSDGLDVDMIIRLYEQFHDRINVIFGWGTNLTNDLGLAALSLIFKVVEVNGYPTVKLSDNIAKATGPSDEIERYKKIFRYNAQEDVAPTY